VKGGYLVGRPVDRYSVQYRITQRGQDRILPHSRYFLSGCADRHS
jgi:hypothetical protein